MASVEPVGTAGLRIELEEVEAALLVSLAQQLVDLVRADDADDADPLVAIVGIDPGARTPDDPALRRLLPDAYADDAKVSETRSPKRMRCFMVVLLRWCGQSR